MFKNIKSVLKGNEKLFIALILSFTAFLFFISSKPTDEAKNKFSTERISSFMPVPSEGSTFVVGAFQSGWDVNFNYINRELGFNLWHIYLGDEWNNGRQYPTGWLYWANNDRLFNPPEEYKADIQAQLSNIGSHNMLALMMRPKIEWLCYGQRSDYQCETVKSTDDLWFYAFNSNNPNHRYTGEDWCDNSIYGEGQMVKRCLRDTNSPDLPGYVVDRLKANTEQCKSVGGYRGDSLCTWYIKPRIRIDSNVAKNQQELLVCRIIVIAQSGNDTLKDINIHAGEFLVDGTQQQFYNGRYIEEFNFPQGTDLTIQGSWGNGWNMFTARGNQSSETGYNLADIQVYWYGNCDMWIDYVRVDNDVADQLLNLNNPLYQSRQQWLQSEAQDIACHDGGLASYRFYIEQFEFNNIPCMAYVTRKLDSLYQICTGGKNISLICMPTPMLYSGHVPWSERFTVQNIEHFKKHFVNKIGVREVLLACYPFNSSYHYPETYPYCTWTKIPSTLNVTLQEDILADTVSPSVYDHWLQIYLDSIPYSYETGYSGGFRNAVSMDQGAFRYTMQFGDMISKQTGLPFIYNTYAGIWFCQCGAPDTGCNNNFTTGEVQREPTNEEMEMTTNVAVSYGAKGLIYFQYTSCSNDLGTEFYCKGIVEFNGEPRYNNVYGQSKWNKVKEISAKLKLWEPYLMSFDNQNRHSYIYRFSNERDTLLRNTYFRDIITYKPGSGYIDCAEYSPPLDDIPPEGWIIECPDERYIQAATFKKINDDGNYYFMIVNRRCSPYINEDNENNRGGKRFIRFYYDANATEFEGYDWWKVTLLGSDDLEEIEFDKRTWGYIDLGYFMPAEGRLYKISPAQ